MNLLKNASFSGNWTRKTHTGQEFGEVFVPEAWTAFWKEGRPVPHDPGNPIGYGRPEMQLINKEAPFLNPPRILDGTRAFKLFTFYRIHLAGLYQTVSGVKPGDKVRASGWSHAWSSNSDNPRYSDGAGESALAVKAKDYDESGGVRNFTFDVGIDPKGGHNPWSSDVVWGEGAHIYNAYAQIPPVEVTAQAASVTMFVRSSVLWPFKHCDAYFDNMLLEVVGEEVPLPEPETKPITLSVPSLPVEQGSVFNVFAEGGQGPRSLKLRMDQPDLFTQGRRVTGDKAYWKCVCVNAGSLKLTVLDDLDNEVSLSINVKAPATPLPEPEPTPPPDPSGFVPPRMDYERTYLLLPPDAGDAWLQAVVESGVWHRYRWTVGGSGDDAGIGPTERRVIAVNAHKWPGNLQEFFDTHYAGAELVEITASTPADLKRTLSSM